MPILVWEQNEFAPSLNRARKNPLTVKARGLKAERFE
jgi:hypothetical protein